MKAIKDSVWDCALTKIVEDCFEEDKSSKDEEKTSQSEQPTRNGRSARR